MTVGSLGDIVFFVNDKTVFTIKSTSWKHSVNYSQHKLHLKYSKMEFTGINPAELEFEIEASVFLGVNPGAALDLLDIRMQNHIPMNFILGGQVIGLRKWVITDLSSVSERFFADGTIMSQTIKVKIKEYE